MEELERNLFSVMPVVVQRSKAVNNNAKILYLEISSLTNQYGYCWASNRYFAKLMGVTPQAISNWIGSLEKAGFVRTEYEKDGMEIVQRRVYLTVGGAITEVIGGINTGYRGYQCRIKENKYNINKDNKNNNTPLPPKGKASPYLSMTEAKEIIAETKFSDKVKTTLTEFVEQRQESKHKMTKRALTMMVNRLTAHWQSDEDRVDSLEKAIISGWRDVYPEKSSPASPPKKSAMERALEIIGEQK